MRIFNGIGELFEFLCKTVVFIVMAVLDAGLTYAYVYFSKDLVKPSGIHEVFMFLWNYGDEYGLSLLAGTLAFMLTILLSLCSLVNVAKFIRGDCDDTAIIFVVKLIISVVLLATSIIFLSGLGSLTFFALLAALIVYLFANSR